MSSTTVLMPCLNEAETLASCLVEAKEALAAAGLDGELLVADNGSTDGSQAIAAAHGARVVNVASKGYGNALRAGIESSEGDYVVFADSDCSYNFGHAPEFVRKLEEGFDLVMGNRFKGGIEAGAMPWHHRYIGNPVLSGIGRLLFGCPVGDFHCGLRAIRRDAFDELQLSTPGMEFASEMVIKATLRDLRIAELPTVLRPDGRTRPPHLRSFRDGWRHLRFMLLFSPRWLFLIPGILLFVTSSVLLFILSQGPLSLGGVELDVHTMLVAAAMAVTSWHVLLVALFARRFSACMGLLPRSRILQRLATYLTLERGLIVGSIAAAAGLFLVGRVTLDWQSTGFGDLDVRSTMRSLIPSITLLVLGVQTVFGSFFLSLLSLVNKTTHDKQADESSLLFSEGVPAHDG